MGKSKTKKPKKRQRATAPSSSASIQNHPSKPKPKPKSRRNPSRKPEQNAKRKYPSRWDDAPVTAKRQRNNQPTSSFLENLTLPVSKKSAEHQEMVLRKKLLKRIKKRSGGSGSGSGSGSGTGMSIKAQLDLAFQRSTLDRVDAVVRELTASHEKLRTVVTRPVLRRVHPTVAEAGSGCPWLEGGKEVMSLHEEMRRFVHYVSLTEKERALRREMVEQVHALLKSIWPEVTLAVYGSFAYGLATFYSDVDMRFAVQQGGIDVNHIAEVDEVEDEDEGDGLETAARKGTADEEEKGESREVGVEGSRRDSGSVENAPSIYIATSGAPRAVSKGYVQHCLKKVRKELLRKRTHPWVRNSEARLRCRVPVVNFTCWNGLEGDLSVEGFGQDSTEIVQHLAKVNGVNEISSVLKVLLKQNDLDKPFTGGLGSFKLYVLVGLHLLRLRRTTFNLHRPTDLGRALMSFLRFYSERRALNQGTVLSVLHRRVEFENNFKVHKVVQVFKRAYIKLVQAERFGNSWNGRMSRLATILSVEPLKVDRDRAMAKAGLKSDLQSIADDDVNRRVIYIQKHLLSIQKPLDFATIREISPKIASRLEEALQRDIVPVVAKA